MGGQKQLFQVLKLVFYKVFKILSRLFCFPGFETKFFESALKFHIDNNTEFFIGEQRKLEKIKIFDTSDYIPWYGLKYALM